jgi:hypothetical protein
MNERQLQNLLLMEPTLLPGDSLLALVDEFYLSGIGYVDLIGVGSGGDITIIECKLKTNRDMRREIVGQVLAYASGVWKMPYDDFVESFSQRAGQSLIQAVVSLEDGPVDEVQFRDSVSNRLEAGEFRLIVAVDEITPELKLIVQYLNEHTLPTVTVLALELTYAREGDFEVLIPAVYGEESAERKQGSRSGTSWNATSLSEQVAALPIREIRDCVVALSEFGRERGYKPRYGAGVVPSCAYSYNLGSKDRSVWAVSLNTPIPLVRLSLETINNWSHDAAASFLNHLRANRLLADVLDPIDESALNKWPTIPVDPVLTDPDALSAFFNALDFLTSSS